MLRIFRELLIWFYWIQTSNLDGETNLKIRKALERTWDYIDEKKAVEFKGMINLLYECFNYYFGTFGTVDRFLTFICVFLYEWK